MSTHASPPGYPPQGHPPQGYPPPKTGIPGWAIALIVAGIGFVVVGVLAAVAIPAFMKYTRRAKTTEAPPNLKKIFDGAKSYYEKGAVVAADSTGTRSHLQFPDPVGLTPLQPCCKQSGKKCRATDWNSPTWQAIGFEISDPHYFQYRFSSEGGNRSAKFTAGAHADLDCDGHLSTYERTGSVDSQMRVVGAASLYIQNDLE